MDPIRNPFAPGAGTRPPELAGRRHIIDAAAVVLGRVKLGRPAKNQLLLGLRGVGKTVLLNEIEALAVDLGFETVVLEAPEERRLAEMLVPKLRSALVRMSRREGAKEKALHALAVLRAFASAFRVSVGDVEFGVAAAPGAADSGSLELDLPDLMYSVGEAARQGGIGLALLIDEVQYLSEEDLAALIVSVHKTAQKGLPVAVFGAGLPQLAGLAGDAKSYAERLFDYPEVGSLDEAAARDAIVVPIEREGERVDKDAVDMIVRTTQGYPYFLQEWGHRTWEAAHSSPVQRSDVESATEAALKALDDGFFRVRLDRLTPREKDYLRAMAELGPGPHRSGDIASALGIEVTRAGPLRSGLIKKGMVYSPKHGDTAFTVPMFDDFMRRTMPDWSPPKKARRRKAR